MAVNSTHPGYDAALAGWLRARDVLAGEDAVKAAGEKYLPRLMDHTSEEYGAYRARASFFNATARTAEGYLGLIFRRPPFVKAGDGQDHGTTGQRTTGPGASPHPADGHRMASQAHHEMDAPSRETAWRNVVPSDGRGKASSSIGKAMEAFVNDADMLGTSLANYAKNVVKEVVAVGRSGTLIDWEDENENRVYASLYAAENIINWRTERINGRNVLTLLVLHEKAEVRGQRSEAGEDSDEFEAKTVEQIRVLKLVAGGEGRVAGAERSLLTSAATGKGKECACQVEVWRPKKDQRDQREKREWELVESRVPLRLGKALPLIPFVFHGPRHALPEVDKLPLADVISVNLDHYRLDADYKHGMHFTALPTAWVSGFNKECTLRIGSSTAWTTDVVGAAAGFLEYTGQGLTTFERALDRDERLMAILGARLLETQKRVGEAAEAIELRQSGENSVLGNLAQSLGASLTQVLRWAYWWNSTEAWPDDVTKDQVVIELNTDFSTKGLSAQEVTAVVQAWQSGALSRDSMMELFRRGEVLPEGRTNEEEARLVGAGGPKNEGRNPMRKATDGTDGTE
jgi:hypothetical protein